MARVCDICGKGVRTGTTIVRHGMAKKKGGIGMHTTGITKRRFLPNVHRIRVSTPQGPTRKTVCATCIKSGKVTKA